MKYYRVDDDGIQEEKEIEIQECILKGIFVDSGEKIELKMDKEQFDDWREKMKGGLK